MSVTFGFYDSLNHDRTYSTLQFSSIFDGIISDGIYATYLDALEVVGSDPVGMSVNVLPGRAWFNHTWTLNDAILTLSIEEPDIALPRIDTVVLEVASGIGTRANRIFIKKGTASSSPVPPTLITGNDGVYQYALANVRVAKQADVTTNGGIRGEDIINKRGESGTPFVTGLLETIDVDNLTAQWSSQFTNMFSQLEDQISQAASQTLIDASVTTQKIANHAISYEYTGLLEADEWSENNGLYYQTIELTCPTLLSNKLLTTDYFIVDVDASAADNSDDMLAMIEAWGSVKRSTCDIQNEVTFVFDSEPDIDVAIKVLGFRR